MTGASGRPAPPQALAGRRATWIEIDLDALQANFKALARAAGGRAAWCVVKADAYGHGGPACGRALERAGAAGLVVALPEEGASLREAGVGIPILLSGPLPPDGPESLLHHQLAPALSRGEDLRRLDEAAARRGVVAPYHLELDSGMTRMGLPPGELDAFLDLAASAAHCRMEGVLSHLASVSRPDDDSARRQRDLFRGLLSRVRARLARDVPAHMASSPALCGFPDAGFDMIRPGLLLYGVTPTAGLRPPADLRPVLSFRTTVVLVRGIASPAAVGYEGTWTAPPGSRLAVIAAGYADGLLRDAAGRAEALLGGRRVPYVGAVNMDLAQLDVTTAGACAAGDVVTLIGHDGGDSLTIDELAARTGRTPYEWLTSLGPRVPRMVHHGDPSRADLPA